MARSGVEVVVTRGGARAMLDHAVGEVMHPGIGPLAEADGLYLAPSRLAARLAAPGDAPLVLFDVGLGAGSNASAAWRCSEARAAGGRRLEIVSFERDLAALTLALEPDHAADFGLDGAAGAAARGLLADGHHQAASTRWSLRRGEVPATLAAEPAGAADVVFWDMYSPRANPALWTAAVFTALFRCCGPRATLHTYSAATASRSALLLAGFAVGLGTSTGAKEHTTEAAVDLRDLARPLDRRWLERLGRSSAPLPADAPADALDRIRGCGQFAG